MTDHRSAALDRGYCDGILSTGCECPWEERFHGLATVRTTTHRPGCEMAGDAPDHPEDSCEECGGRNVVWFAPNDLWNRVMRGGERGAPDVFGIVCPVCFILRAETIGVEATGWLVQPEVIHADA